MGVIHRVIALDFYLKCGDLDTGSFTGLQDTLRLMIFPFASKLSELTTQRTLDKGLKENVHGNSSFVFILLEKVINDYWLGSKGST